MKRLCSSLRSVMLVVCLVFASGCSLPLNPDGSSLDFAELPFLENPTSGLENLKSYRTTMNIRFTGKDPQGQEFLTTIETVEEKSADQGVGHFLFLSSGQPNLPTALEYYQVQGSSYLLSSAMGSNPTCLRADNSVLEQGSGLALLPQQAFRNIENAEMVAQGEMINNVATNHYRAASGDANEQSEIWVAQEGGYIVRFTGYVEGQIQLSSASGTGLIGWEYNLTDINQLSQIAIPEQCLVQAGANIPLPDSAENVAQDNISISFTSPESAEAVAEFYRQNLPAQGWEIEQEGGTGQAFSFTASRDGKAITILVTQAAALTQVTIQK